MKENIRIAILGGSGFYGMKGISGAREVRLRTPFGSPSDSVLVGSLAGVRCAFLARHGRGHVLLPSEINARANLYALKSLGVERILSVGAVGSLREEIAPRHLVFPDQLVDETKRRPSTFFGEGLVAHVSFADPFCGGLSRLLYEEAARLGIPSRLGGTYVCMEGPQFSTKAESEYHRRQGYDLIGMTALPEAKLAREAEICYAAISAVTDYDCWKEGEEVTTGKVVENLFATLAQAERLIEAALPRIASVPRDCPCGTALKGAIFTVPSARNKRTLVRLGPLVARFKDSQAASA